MQNERREKTYCGEALYEIRTAGTTDEDFEIIEAVSDDGERSTVDGIEQHARKQGWEGPSIR